MASIRITHNMKIGEDSPCFIIAEAGINHNGNIKLAKEMIDVAKACGVDAVKFQTFKAEDFISDPTLTYTYFSQDREVTESMLEMFKRYQFDKNEWYEIANYCKAKDIIFFSTAQNPSDLDFLFEITDMPIIKVGSDDLTNIELLKYYAGKNKPMIISAGMAYLYEIEEAVTAIRSVGNRNLAILHCVSSYPARAEELNLKKMHTIKNAFDVIVGFSDHTDGITAAVGAVALGAKIIEKHFTLDKELPGPDHWFSSSPAELQELVEGVRFIEKAFGSGEIKPTPYELEMRDIARRSIVAAKDITAGEILKRDMLDFKRPGTGLPPSFSTYLIGKQIRVDIKKNDLITFEHI
jgi:N,N'-diacetyllegionaminate synthase